MGSNTQKRINDVMNYPCKLSRCDLDSELFRFSLYNPAVLRYIQKEAEATLEKLIQNKTSGGFRDHMQHIVNRCEILLDEGH